MLEQTNWDFPESKTSRGIHALHPYPARFIPEIPRKLIQLYSPAAGSWVFDPFCGSGTTLVEAAQAGLNAVGVDVNPLACLIARVKISQLPAEFQTEGEGVLSRARRLLKEDNVVVPHIPNLDHWFAPEAERELSALVTEIGHVEQMEIREALEVALSRIIVEVSYQESDTRYAAVPKELQPGNVLQAFTKSVKFVGSCLSTNLETKLFGDRGHSIVIHHDTLTLQPTDLPGPVGLVITSPPYPNAYEYWLYHKYRMYWLGMDPISARQSEIGARPHYFTRKSGEPDFEKQMGTCFALLSNVMVRGSRACFVISNSIIHGAEVDNTKSLTRAAGPHGFVLEDKTSRKILQHRRSFNVRRNRKEEFLLVFRMKQ